jgi:hypothetical protein
MPSIDINVTDEVREMFDLPPCSEIRLPSAEPLKVQLPGGGTLSAFSDISKGIPTDCAMTFSLIMQLGPFLAATACLVKVLKFVQTAVDVLKSASNPISLVSSIPKVVQAAEPVIECALSFTPSGLIPFIRDLLCLILKVLKCFRDQMASILKILEQTGPQIQIAQQSGNDELLQSLQCAQDNAMTQAQQMTQSLEALSILLDLAGDLMQIVGVDPIKLPKLGAQVDLSSLNQFVQTVQQVEATIQIVVDALGGCN